MKKIYLLAILLLVFLMSIGIASAEVVDCTTVPGLTSEPGMTCIEYPFTAGSVTGDMIGTFVDDTFRASFVNVAGGTITGYYFQKAENFGFDSLTATTGSPFGDALGETTFGATGTSITGTVWNVLTAKAHGDLIPQAGPFSYKVNQDVGSASEQVSVVPEFSTTGIILAVIVIAAVAIVIVVKKGKKQQ